MVCSAGIRSNATKREAKRAIVTVMAKCANRAPPNPFMSSSGRKMTTLVNVDAISDGAMVYMACGSDVFFSLVMDSITTMPQSTSMPTHMVNPPNDIMLILMENMFMKKKVMIIDTGIAMVIMSAE